MQIWILNPFDDIPGEGKPQRYWTLAENLARRGHQVVWWSSDFSHRTKTRRTAIGSNTSFKVRLVRSGSYRRNIGLKRILSHRSYGRALFREGCAAVASGELEKPDLILASLPPLEGPAAALRLRDRFGCRVITDIMDAWPDTLLQAVPNRPLARAFGRLLLRPYASMLRRACRNSDAVSAQSETFADFAMKHGARGVGNVCYLGSEPATMLKRKPASPLRLIYLGAMGRSYDLDTVVDAVTQAREEGAAVELVMVGDGEKRPRLEARNLPGIRYTGYLRGAELERELIAADLGVVPFFRESGVAVPYKAGDYLAYSLPLLSSLDGELGALIRLFHCGIVYSPGDGAALAAAITAYASNFDRVARESENARRCFAEKFDRTRIYPAFAEWVEEIASGVDGPRTASASK